MQDKRSKVAQKGKFGVAKRTNPTLNPILSPVTSQEPSSSVPMNRQLLHNQNNGAHADRNKFKNAQPFRK